MFTKVLARCSMLALTVSLAACGGGTGGGVNSTPTPAPAPTPTPTPTPTPPPSTANADLLTLTQSESFTNDATTGSVNYPKSGGSGTSTSATANISIVFDAASRTYTITNGARTQSFGSANLDAAASNSQISVFKKTSGTTTDTLTLTKPGTTGALNYKYVGGGFWQRTVDGATAITGDLDAFTYGVETPEAAIVRTGGASYAVDLLGAVARPHALFSLSGSGSLTVNFFDGAITGGSSFNGARETQSDNGAPGLTGLWRFSGTLASAQNAITGTMSLYDDSSAPVRGAASGRLFGPGSDEIGIAFRGSGADGTNAVGVLVGRKSATTISGNNATLTNLQFNETFLGWSTDRSFFVSATTGLQTGDVAIPQTGDLRLAYRAGSQGFAVQSSGSVLSDFSSSDLVPAQSNARYSVYEQTSGSTVSRLDLYKPGSSNDEFALTYASFAKYQRTEPQPNGGDKLGRVGYIAFGVPTPNSAVPLTGTGSYTGIVRGEGQAGAGSTLPLLAIEGTARLDFDFARAAFGGSMNLTAVNPTDNARFDLGAFPFSDGRLTSGAGFAHQGNFYGTINGNNNNQLFGFLMGPNAEELSAIFKTTFITPGTGFFGGVAQGVILGKKAP